MKNLIKAPLRAHSLFLLPILSLGAITTSHAATLRWSGAANGDTNWNKTTGSGTTNWLPNGQIPGANDDVIFGQDNVNDQALLVKLNGNRTVNTLEFSRNDDGTKLYRLDSGLAAGINTLTVRNGLEVERGEHEVFCHVELQNSMTWEISNFGGSGFTDGLLRLEGQLIGGDDIVLRLTKGGSTNNGTLELNDRTETFTGTFEHESGILSYNNQSLGSAYYKRVGDDAQLFIFGGGNVRFGGLQYSTTTFPNTNLVVGSRGLEVTSGSEEANPQSIGRLGAEREFVLNGTFYCDISASDNDEIVAGTNLDIRTASLEVRGEALDFYEERVIATYATRTGEFDISALPAGYSVRYDATEAVLIGPAPSIIHVDANATGAGTGHDWANAFTSLQDALTLARNSTAQPTFTNEIWVAKGVYTPDATGTDRTASFEMIDGVNIYGGFAGTETARSERDINANVTVLSGDIDGDDTKDTDGVTLTADDIVDNNSHSVVFAGEIEFELNGFTISGGQANLTTGEGPGGSYGRGGAAFVDTTTTKTPTFMRCRFYGNLAQQGGAVFTHQGGSVNFHSCDFRGNKSNARGGACYLWRTASSTTNCNFSGNLAGDDGGAIYDDVLAVGSTEYLNCTFTGNRAVDNGGAINLSFTSATNPNTPVMINTVVWDNLSDAPGTSNDSVTSIGSFDVFFSLVEHVNFGTLEPTNLNGTVSGNAPNFAVAIDPNTAPTVAGNPVPNKNDAIVDEGSDASLNGLSEDITGGPRISGFRVDMGAYEIDQTPPVITLIGDPIITVELDDLGTFDDPGVTAFDTKDGDLTDNVIVIGNVNMGSLTPDLLTYLVFDAAGNVGSLGRSVVKMDTTKPTITAPADIAGIEITDPAGVAVVLGSPTNLEDNSSTDPTPSNNAPSLFPLGTTAVTWTSQDPSGNVSDPDIQLVLVVDTTDPVIDSSTLPDIEESYTGPLTSVTLSNPTASDNGTATQDLIITNNAPSGYPLGTTIVEWTVTDSEGNFSKANQNVIISDTTPPTITAPANFVALEGNADGGYTGLDLGQPTGVSDNVDTMVEVTNNAPSLFPVGVTTTVTWTAEDDAGNKTEVQQTVEVVDTTAPVLTLIGDSVVQFDLGMEFAIPGVTVFDVCDPGLSVVTAPLLNPFSDPGVYVVTYNATDASGNVAAQVERTVILGALSSTYCVDDLADFTITDDRGAAGFSFGDVVTWNSPNGDVPNLAWGLNAHTNLVDALANVPDGGTVQIGAGTFDAGEGVAVTKSVTIQGSGANATHLTGSGYEYIMIIAPFAMDVTVENLSFTDAIPNDGGGVFASSSDGAVRVNNVKFAGNTIGFGVMLELEKDIVFTNCEISGCLVSNSDFLFRLDERFEPMTVPKFINCTIAGNEALRLEPQFGNSYAVFENCMISGNNFTSLRAPSPNVEFRNSLVQDVTPAELLAVNAASTGNLDASDVANAPLFLNAVSFSSLPSSAGDYRVASNSPMVDAGNNALNASVEDLLGNTRVIGFSIDIGAHEVVDTSIQGGIESFIFTDASGLGTFELNDLLGDFTGSPTSYALAENSNPDLVGVNLVGSKVNVTLDQAGYALLRFSATNGTSTGVHTIYFGVAASPVFVDRDATGAGTGLSWADAFTNINDAISAQFPDSALDVWIADGVYSPDEGRGKQSGDVDAVIVLNEGVRLYGGFTGGETQFNQRDPEANLSIISGDLDGNDVDGNGDNIVDDYSGIVGENSHLLMECYQVSASTVIDGLVFTGGDARNSSTRGPCVFADESSLQVNQCRFQGNYGENDEGSSLRFDGLRRGGRENYRPVVSHCDFIGNNGGENSGIYVDNSVLTIEYCRFIDNRGDRGAGVFLDESTVTVSHCEFRGNQAEDGGAIYVEGDENGAQITISNCLITGNSATIDGAVVDMTQDLEPVSLTFESCTIVGNYSSGSSTFNQIFALPTSDCSLIFENSVVWGNAHGLGLTKELLITAVETLEMRNSLVELYTAVDANAASANSSGNLDGTLIANDPLFTNSPSATTAPFTGGDYRIPANSPLIDTGDNSLNTVNYDLDGSPRIVNALIDIGAYEGAPSDYAKWIAQFYPNETDVNVIDRNADNGGNGLPNKLSFITNTDPRSITGGSNVVTQTVDADYLVLDFPRRDDATEFNPVIEWSIDLANFVDSVHGVNGVIINVIDDAYGVSADGVGVDKVEVRIPKNDEPRLFGRLKVN